LRLADEFLQQSCFLPKIRTVVPEFTPKTGMQVRNLRPTIRISACSSLFTRAGAGQPLFKMVLFAATTKFPA